TSGTLRSGHRLHIALRGTPLRFPGDRGELSCAPSRSRAYGQGEPGRTANLSPARRRPDVRSARPAHRTGLDWTGIGPQSTPLSEEPPHARTFLVPQPTHNRFPDRVRPHPIPPAPAADA